AVALDLGHGHVDVVRPGQIARGPDERVVVEHVDDAGDLHEHVVVADLRLGAAAAADLLGALAAAAPTVAEPTAPPAAPAGVVVVVHRTTIDRATVALATVTRAPVAL